MLQERITLGLALRPNKRLQPTARVFIFREV